jgi:peptidyl-prolyl cis-trans isomerase SurA
MALPGFSPLARPITVAASLLLGLGLILIPHALAESSIRILVNDEPITSYDVQQRTAMLRTFTSGREGERAAIEQLIDERLMMQEAERRNVQVSDEEVEQEFADRARGANLTPAQFSQALRQAGFEPDTFNDFLRARIAWQQIVQARFRATVDISEQDVAAALTGREDTGTEERATEYMLQPIIFVIPAGAGASVQAQRRNEANAFRNEFRGCDYSLEQVAGTVGIVVKPQVRREEGQLSPSLKEALAALDVGGITAPELVAEGIQLIAVCAKNEIAGQTEATVEVREELANERGQLLARRYLRDLRSDAVIEYR